MSPEPSQTDQERRELSTILWKYRESLERVEFLLEAQVAFSNGIRTERLGTIADLLDETVSTIGELDLRREILLCSLAPRRDLGSPPPTLSSLIADYDGPWQTVFRDHQAWFEKAVVRIRAMTNEGRLVMTSTLDLMEQLVAAPPTIEDQTYDRQGRTLRPTSRPLLFDGRV